MRNLLVLTVVCLLAGAGLHAQQTISSLFARKAALQKDYHALARQYEALELNLSEVQRLRAQAPDNLELQLPYGGGGLSLVLHKSTITAPGFSLVEALGNGKTRQVPFTLPVSYQGTIKGKEGSFATLSVLDGQVMAIISDEKGNMILGAVEQQGKPTTEYILYRESDLLVPSPLQCFTDDPPEAHATVPSPQQASLPAALPVLNLYFECDNKMYRDKGSNSVATMSYVLGFFNNVSLLYAREGITVQVSQIKVWTVADPYAGYGNVSTILSYFSSNLGSTSFTGDYAHFLTTRNAGGGVAYTFDNPCVFPKSSRAATSHIYDVYEELPVYHWTVQVVTHETGHNFGSRHTHWCGWQGGPLDNCYAVEAGPNGTCPRGPAPVNGGTIMSYCHLTSSGINFSNGFGPQPGNKIRSVLSAASCFRCKLSFTTTVTNPTCGFSNGSATITPAGGDGNYSYFWSNGQTGATLTGVLAGTYVVEVKDGSGCSQVQEVVIREGVEEPVVTPAGPTTFCAGGSVVLNAPARDAGTYQWYKDESPVDNATGTSYTATATGNYTVKATTGGCSGSSDPVPVTVITPPVAAISPAGSAAICSGGSVVLQATAGAGYQYQWYRNGVLVDGASAASLTVSTQGTYRAVVSNGTCQSASNEVSVALSTPTAAVTASGPAAFCEGGSVVLSTPARASYTYQWYKDNVLLDGATAASYTATATGSYTVKAMTGGCVGTSSPVPVMVLAPPAAAISPAGSTAICSGGNVVLQATAGAGYQYQWYRNGVLVDGASAASLTVSTQGTYKAVVSNGTCQSASNEVSITVTMPAAAVTAAGPAAFCEGGSVVLTATAGSGYTYQWYKDNVFLDGATAASYTAAAAGAYRVQVTEGGCSNNSPSQAVTVWPRPEVRVSPDKVILHKYASQTLTVSGAETVTWSALPGLISSSGKTAIVRPLTTTVYNVEGVDAKGCRNTASAEVTVVGCGEIKTPAVTLLTPSRVAVQWTNPEGTSGDTLQYRVVGSEAWTSVYVPGAAYELSGLLPGTQYEYRVVPLCTGSTVFLPSAVERFQTSALSAGTYMQLSPNPAYTQTRLEVIYAKAFTLVVRVFNSNGQLVLPVLQQTRPGGQALVTLDVSTLTSGVYLVNVLLNGQSQTLRMVVARK
ncbi:M12 family metallo-peptidase [Paraflavisolibacter sp. H34]|uniref:Ig-like domain-containing protein n=1 Tax=Huijunlia imazamoxiresistens TaxID=3127457 RepID=UPI0030190197